MSPFEGDLCAAILILAAVLRFWQIGELEPFLDEGGNILTSIDPGIRQTINSVALGRVLLDYQFRAALLFPEAAITISRVTTGLAGLLTTLAIGLLAKPFVGRKITLIAMAIWAVLPFAVFHERLALQDPFVTACIVLALALVVKGVELRENITRERVMCLFVGIVFGVGFLIKISAVSSLVCDGIILLGATSPLSPAVI